MKRLLIALLFIPLLGYSQNQEDITILQGAANEWDLKGEISGITKDESNIFLLREESLLYNYALSDFERHIEKYDRKLNLISKIDLKKVIKSNKIIHILGLSELDKDLLLLVKTASKNGSSLSKLTLNKGDLMFKSITELKDLGVFNKKSQHIYDFKSVNNGEKFLISEVATLPIPNNKAHLSKELARVKDYNVNVMLLDKEFKELNSYSYISKYSQHQERYVKYDFGYHNNLISISQILPIVEGRPYIANSNFTKVKSCQLNWLVIKDGKLLNSETFNHQDVMDLIVIGDQNNLILSATSINDENKFVLTSYLFDGAFKVFSMNDEINQLNHLYNYKELICDTELRPKGYDVSNKFGTCKNFPRSYSLDIKSQSISNGVLKTFISEKTKNLNYAQYYIHKPGTYSSANHALFEYYYEEAFGGVLEVTTPLDKTESSVKVVNKRLVRDLRANNMTWKTAQFLNKKGVTFWFSVNRTEEREQTEVYEENVLDLKNTFMDVGEGKKYFAFLYDNLTNHDAPQSIVNYHSGPNSKGFLVVRNWFDLGNGSALIDLYWKKEHKLVKISIL
jgi:hypothetical protein